MNLQDLWYGFCCWWKVFALVFISGHLWYQRPNCHISWPPHPRGHGQRCTWTSRENSPGSKAMCGSLQTDQQSIDATNKNVMVFMIAWYIILKCNTISLRHYRALAEGNILDNQQLICLYMLSQLLERELVKCLRLVVAIPMDMSSFYGKKMFAFWDEWTLNKWCNFPFVFPIRK